VGPAVVLLFNQSVLADALAAITKADAEAKCAAFIQVPELRQWAPTAMEKVTRLFFWATVKPGEFLQVEGRPANNFGVVASGECAVYRDAAASSGSPRSKRPRRVLVGTLGAGATFGEVSVLGRIPSGARRLSQRSSVTSPTGVASDVTAPRAPLPDKSSDMTDFVEPYTIKAVAPTRVLMVDQVAAKELDPLLVLQMCGETRHGFDRLSLDELVRLEHQQAEQAKWAKLKEDIRHDVQARRH